MPDRKTAASVGSNLFRLQKIRKLMCRVLNSLLKPKLLYKIDIRSPALPSGGEATEFFLIENRNKDSGATFDTHLPESGILILAH